MCTAVTLHTRSHYFGRNLDLEYSYNETVTVMPRNYPLVFCHAGALQAHYAMTGMAYVQDGYPLYYDATNEKGLSMAGLNFPENADYKPEVPGMDNIAPFEFIPWVLGQCADVQQARELLSRINLVNRSFRDDLPLTPLHWIIAGQREALTVESVRDGLMIYDNPIGILTNNPPFPYQMFNLNNYMGLSSQPPVNRFSEDVRLEMYSRGMGSIGLPGDFSSASRFVRAAFLKLNSVCMPGEDESVSQFFHILDSLAHPRGSVDVGGGRYQITVYSSCCNMDSGVYYYKTYENSRLSAVDMHREDLDGSALKSYPLIGRQQVYLQNG